MRWPDDETDSDDQWIWESIAFTWWRDEPGLRSRVAYQNAVAEALHAMIRGGYGRTYDIGDVPSCRRKAACRDRVLTPANSARSATVHGFSGAASTSSPTRRTALGAGSVLVEKTASV